MGEVDVQVELYESRAGKLIPGYADPLPVMPDGVVYRVVTAKCLREPSYVRMQYRFEVENEKGEIIPIVPESLEKIILVEEDTRYWTEKDGWWYYNTPLDTDESAKPLFDQIEFYGPYITNDFQNATVRLLVTAQSVQLANNGDGKDVFTAFGWPEA